jgi:hypothetical protein
LVEEERCWGEKVCDRRQQYIKIIIITPKRRFIQHTCKKRKEEGAC